MALSLLSCTRLCNGWQFYTEIIIEVKIHMKMNLKYQILIYVSVKAGYKINVSVFFFNYLVYNITLG